MTWIVQLIDTAEEHYSYLYEVSTEDESKTLEDFEEVYDKARDEWYESINNEFDCLIAHITMRLEENGFSFYEITPELDLDF